MIRDAFPKLIDTSLEGRRRFLDEWEDRLWAYWEEQLSILIADRCIAPAAALGRTWSGPEHDACRMIADRMVEALRERPTLQQARPWSDVAGWYAWFVGSRAMAAHRHREELLDEAQLDAIFAAEYSRDEPAPDPDADEIRVDVTTLIDEWASNLHRIVEGTGIAAIERDWLWATCNVRRPLSQYLGEVGMRAVAGASRLIEHRRRALARATSAPGSSPAERIERTRCGAAACFRFNLATWGRDRTELASAHRVFLGQADSRPPYRPLADVDRESLDGVRRVLRLAAAAGDVLKELDVVAHLRARVAECALRASVARLLPRADELKLLKEWDELVAPRRSP
jgi:hypothetical protein